MYTAYIADKNEAGFDFGRSSPRSQQGWCANMGRKVRKQINIDEAHDRILREEAARLGVSESEVVRRAIELLVDEKVAERRRRAQEDLFELLAVIRARRVKQGGGVRYDFVREDAYEERLERYDK